MRARALVLWFTALAAWGCDSSEGEGASVAIDPGPSARDQFALEIATALCEGVEPCCSSADLEEPSERCVRDMRNEVFIALLRAEEERRTVLTEAADECVDAFRRELVREDLCRKAPLPRDLLRICPTLFSEIPEGSFEPGTLCEGTWQCRSPERGARACYQKAGENERLCTWFLSAEPEADCSDARGYMVECSGGSVCRPEDDADPTRRRCLPAAYDGGPCAGIEGCAEGYACGFQPELGVSQCVPERALGEPCFDQPDACGADAYCPVTTWLCTLLPVNQCPPGGCPTALDLVCR